MEMSFIYELIGYVGSLLVATSLMMKSLVRLRVINLAGTLIFVIFGFLIGAEPIILLNVLILGVNIYHLVQMWQQKHYFNLLEVSHDSTYLQSFLEFYHDEIISFFPSY